MFHRNEQDLMNRNEHLLINTVKMFVQLRQDLERVRNLTYMTLKREKLKKQIFTYNNEIFLKQADYLKRYSTSGGIISPAPATSAFASVLQQKSMNTINSPASSNSLAAVITAASSSVASGATHSINSRLREILQTKQRACIYDFPELWSLSSTTAHQRLHGVASLAEAASLHSSISSSLPVSSESRVTTRRSLAASSTASSRKTTVAKVGSTAKFKAGQNASSRSEFVNRIKNKYKAIKLNKKKV
jgi:hypothetical protein